MPLYITSTKRLNLSWLELRSNRAANYGDHIFLGRMLGLNILRVMAKI